MTNWIEWKGGKCPVPPETVVIPRYRDGVEGNAAKAFARYWQHEGDDVDIIAYRILAPSAAEATGGGVAEGAETLWCESCGEAPATVRLDVAGLCASCAEADEA